ncbi:MAG TPA: hypothetical protein VFN97_00200 [Actinospica sp.]|nr:hypothetical protein [Actinospica sp.]
MRSTPTRSAAACAIAAAVLTLTACTGSSTQAQPGPGSSAASSSSAGASYTTSSDVVSALKTAGHPCAAISDSGDTNIKAPGLQSASACSISKSGTPVTAVVFDNHTDAQVYADTMTSSQVSGLLIGGTNQRAVLGSNWVVVVPDDAAYAQQVSKALGGALVGGATSSAG